MSNLTLEQELILLAVLAFLIAWVMGRTFCKSKEHQVRSQFKQQKRESHRLESLLKKKEREIEKLSSSMQAEHQTLIETTQKLDLSQTSYQQLRNSHEDILKELQGVQGDRVRLTELSKHHDEQSAEYLALQEYAHQLKTELQESKQLQKQQKLSLEKSCFEHNELSQQFDEQLKNTLKLESTLQNQQKLLAEREMLLKETEYKWASEKTKTKELQVSQDELIKRNSMLKESLQDTEDMLEKNIRSNKKYQRELAQQVHENNVLKSDVTSYKILSTIK